jgi:preprotein translocase subunit Sss1
MDNGSNYLKAAKIMKLEVEHCVGHSLHLCLNEAMESISEVSQFIKKIKRLIKHFRKSDRRTWELVRLAKANGLVLQFFVLFFISFEMFVSHLVF